MRRALSAYATLRRDVRAAAYAAVTGKILITCYPGWRSRWSLTPG